MGNEIATVGGALATAGTSVAAGLTFGQVPELNNAVVDCANFTGKRAQETTVRYVGEAAGHAIATAGVAVAAGVTLGQVDALNKAVVDCANNTARSGEKAGESVVQAADEVTDGIPGIAHVKGGILYAAGEKERGDRAMKSGSRAIGTMAGGAAGLLVGGPVGAAAGGIAGGAAMDGIITGIDSAVHKGFRPSGQIDAWDRVARAKSPDDVVGGVVDGFMTPLLDGVAGAKKAKASRK